ncbi:MAG: helix-turn-helix domain-containing protein [Oscillospiraceae bacterium]|nr:helix-turn-helix domain-containing protein [Oscillospiraceae bacterium]
MITEMLIHFLEKNYTCAYDLPDEDFIGIEIGADSNMNGELPNVLFIVGEDNANIFNQTDSKLILCRSIKSLPRQKNCILIETEETVREVFDKINVWWQEKVSVNEILLRMYMAMPKKQYLGALLDTAYIYMGNPIMIVDHTHHLVDYRQKNPVSIKKWQSLIDNGLYDLSLIDDYFFKKQKEAAQTREVLRIELGKHRAYTCSIVCDEIYMGVVSLLEYERTVTEHDVEILKTVAEIISIKMEQTKSYPEGTEYQYGLILFDLLYGKIRGENELSYRMASRNWKPKSNNQVLLIRTKDKEMAKHARKSFAEAFPSLKCIVLEGEALVLLETDAGIQIPGGIDDFCIRHNASAGASAPFNDLMDLRIYYEQARKALEFGRRTKRIQTVSYYRDFMLEDIAAQFTSVEYPQQFYHPIIQKLEAYDLENNTDFGETFYAYIELSRSVSKTSEKLYLHKNTVNYRVQRVKELFGVDLDDFRELAHIYISHKMHVENGIKEKIGISHR